MASPKCSQQDANTAVATSMGVVLLLLKGNVFLLPGPPAGLVVLGGANGEFSCIIIYRKCGISNKHPESDQGQTLSFSKICLSPSTDALSQQQWFAPWVVSTSCFPSAGVLWRHSSIGADTHRVVPGYECLAEPFLALGNKEESTLHSPSHTPIDDPWPPSPTLRVV